MAHSCRDPQADVRAPSPHDAPWTPETARTEARCILGEIADGNDPQQRRFDDRSAPDVSRLCDRYLEEGLFAAKPSSVASARNNIENHVKPLIGSRRAASLERGDIEAMMRDIAASKTARRVKQGPRRLARVRGGKGAVNSALVTLSAAIGFGIGGGLWGTACLRTRIYSESS